MRRLTAEQKNEMRNALKEKSLEDVMRDYGVSRSTVHRLKATELEKEANRKKTEKARAARLANLQKDRDVVSMEKKVKEVSIDQCMLLRENEVLKSIINKLITHYVSF